MKHFHLKLLTAAIAVAAAASANAESTGAQMAVVAHAATLRPGESVVGALDVAQPIHIEVALKLRNHAQLRSFLAAAQSPSVLIARRTMSPQAFAARHSPTQAQANAVANYLRQAGFTHVTIAPNRLLVSADGRADVVKAAFQTQFARVRNRQGRVGFMNTADIHIPAALQDMVLSVVGLQSVHAPHTMAKASLQPMSVTGHNPVSFSAIYGGAGVNNAAGVTVGIVTQGRITQTISDLNTFTSQNGLPAVTTQTINTNGTSSDTSGVGEWNLDSQDIVGAAGGQVGKIIFYNIPTLSNANLTADINRIVSDNQAKIINVSLGECETYTQQDGSAAADDQAFQQAIAQGQTFSVSSGDSGADECGNGGTTPSAPASSPYVVAVGGTRLNTSGNSWSGETVWSGTGGSPSTFEPKPSWQNAVVSGTKRGVPDIAFDADPNSGALVIVNGSTQQIGGTSLSAPIFAGIWARILAAKGTGLGFAAPLIYQLPASDFHDVTSGSNGGESAHAGWDFTTGFGSMIISNVMNDIGGGSGGNNPPVAAFGDTVSGLTVNFTDSSTDSDGSISSRAWNFGDGGTSTATNPSHTYASSGTYTVSLTVTDNDGASNTVSHSVTVSSGGGGTTVLQNGVPVTGVSGAAGDDDDFSIQVPAGASNLVMSISGGSGDADLYTRFGSAPTLSTYDCRPYLYGNTESCSVASPQAGTYYIKVHGYAAYSGVTVKASYSTGGGGGGLQNGVPVTGLSGSRGTKLYYTVTVPAGSGALTIATSGGSGDEDLYVKLGSNPTLSSYDCRPYRYGNNESCTFNAPAGTYHIMLNGYSSFSGVTLKATW